MKDDLILLHAPSVYDFRERQILFGPVSDVVPSTQVFEMYPIGFLTILEHLQKQDLNVRIINVALKMLNSRRFDAEKLIKKLRPGIFGIDLHWMVHAQGALELAKLIKKHHPDIPVVFGGLSSSVFHEELVNRPEVDYVLRGDSTENALAQLVRCIRDNTSPDEIPNLTYKKEGIVKVNPVSDVSPDLNSLSFDYRSVMKATFRSVLKHLDFLGHIPFKSWIRYPILAALTCRGCIHNCVICGGSAHAYSSNCGRKKPAFRDPELLVKDIVNMSAYIKAPVIVLGDLLQGGEERFNRFLELMKKEKVKNHIALEFFIPPEKKLVEKIGEAIPNYNIQISPESHDEKVRRAFGRPYGNRELEAFIENALNNGCRRIDVFFMIGLPEQTRDSVMETVDYCRTLLSKFGTGNGKGRFLPFISPLSPFLDPGSRAFTDPPSHGYKLLRKTLQDHIDALEEPSWKYTLNYETEWMSRDDIADVTYEAALELNRIKLEFGIISEKDARNIEKRVSREKEIMLGIDKIRAETDAEKAENEISALLLDFQRWSDATICRKEEMNWPSGFFRFNPFTILKHLILKK